ncbi:hypothetical protein ACS0TY_015865 [Phlomoides rotata]
MNSYNGITCSKFCYANGGCLIFTSFHLIANFPYQPSNLRSVLFLLVFPLDIEAVNDVFELMRMTRGFVILKLISRMLQKILTSPSESSYNPETDHDFEEVGNSLLTGLPEDVQKGHFVVHTVDGGESRRFVLELSYLAHPGFLKLLEQAEQEFGFKQTGILAIPCTHSDLQSILQTKE